MDEIRDGGEVNSPVWPCVPAVCSVSRRESEKINAAQTF